LGAGKGVDFRHAEGTQAQAQIGPHGTGRIVGKTGQKGGRNTTVTELHAREERVLGFVLKAFKAESVVLSLEDHASLGAQEDGGPRIFRGIEEEGPRPEAQPLEAGIALPGGEARGEPHSKAYGQDRPQGLPPELHPDLQVDKDLR
jgi:hypothetical protein